MSRDEISRIIKRYLEENDLDVESNKTIYKDIKVDLFAVKEERGEKIRALVLIILNREDIISAFTNSSTYTSLPGITHIYIAAPVELIQPDIMRIAEYIGFGLYSIKEGELEQSRPSRDFPNASLGGGGGYPSSVLPGQTFEVYTDLEVGDKIIPYVEVSCIVGRPFTIAEGESATRKIEDLKPRQNIKVNFKVKIDKNVQIGKYPIFISRWGDGIPLYVNMFQIQVKEEDEDTIKQAVQNAITELKFATSTNIEGVLSQIEEAIFKNVIDIKENVTDKSVWNDIGIFCLNNGLYKQAELVYNRMLETIQKQENRSHVRLHKGLALHNLGMALFLQGRLNEAKLKITEAFQEDKITYGEDKAREMTARKALTNLFKES